MNTSALGVQENQIYWKINVRFSVFIIRREPAPGKGHGICIFVTAVEIAAGLFMDVVVSERMWLFAQDAARRILRK
jgi:hypothetical protein